MTDHLDTPRSSTCYSHSRAQHSTNITEILVQLWEASTEGRKLQIVHDTMMLQAATTAWTIHEGAISYNDRLYMLASPPLLQDVLKSLGTTASHLLALGLHTMTSSLTTQAFPLSILLQEADSRPLISPILHNTGDPLFDPCSTSPPLHQQ